MFFRDPVLAKVGIQMRIFVAAIVIQQIIVKLKIHASFNLIMSFCATVSVDPSPLRQKILVCYWSYPSCLRPGATFVHT